MPKKEITKSKKSASSEYGAESITVLEGLDPVRKRPGMYIGSTSAVGLHHLVWEVVDNGIDEAMAGYADEIWLTLQANGYVEMRDNGRGIPVGIHSVTKVSALETVMTKLHAGGKFGGGGYKVSGGLHGVGVSVVNALSSHTKVEVHREGKIWMQEYKIGKPQAKVKAIGTAKDTSTTVTFKPDASIFTETEFKWGTILDRMRQQAYLTKGITINVADRRAGHRSKDFKFHFEGGIRAYIKALNQYSTPKHPTIFYVEKDINDSKVEVALQYNDQFNEEVFAFANNIHNPEGGTHMVGFRTALTRSLNAYARKQNLLKEKDENLTGDDTREGLTAIVSVKLTDPQFEGQTKGKLGNAEMKNHVEQIFGEAFGIFLEENPKEAEAIVGKCVLASQARIAARTARASILRKGALEGMTLPGKLADCSSRKAEECELYIVEGDSAGGCFSGDTKIALADGRNVSFKQLVQENRQGKKHYCYTINDRGSIEINDITNPRCTTKNAKVIKVILDNNEEITCTPDHKFMLADGSYKEAQHLTTNDSLQPLNKKLSKIKGRITIAGYEMVFDPAKKQWIFTHVLSDRYNVKNNKYTIQDGEHKHHVDFNKLNNSPDNIVRIAKDEHLELHRKHIAKTLHRPDVIKKLRALHQTKDFRKKMSERMKEPQTRAVLRTQAKKQWEDDTYKEYMSKKFLEFYHDNKEYRLKNNALLYNSQKEYWAQEKNRKKQANRVKNYFIEHPEKKKELVALAKKQWHNEDLRNWRSETTKKQWTPAFRNKRLVAYNTTYLNKALATLKQILEQTNSINEVVYNEVRKKTKDRSLLRLDTICNRFFCGDRRRLKEAVVNYNHKIKAVIPLNHRMDVYDIEVPKTHNFALASGIFVHNSAKQGRDRKFQAILPLRGKILNVERARLDKMLANNEIKNLVIAMGTNIDEQMDVEKLRYHRIIIMTDADVDGAHIRTLLLTLFYRHFKPIVEKGHLYIAQPPLYQIKKGKEAQWVYSDKEKDEAIRKLGGIPEEQEVIEEIEAGSAEQTAAEAEAQAQETQAKSASKIHIQRYKGLGEMNPDQLWETTMNPQNRILLQVSIEDAIKADETFEILMGTDVVPRRKFIQTQAKHVQNLDV